MLIEFTASIIIFCETSPKVAAISFTANGKAAIQITSKCCTFSAVDSALILS